MTDSRYDEFVSQINDNFSGARYLIKNREEFNLLILTGIKMTSDFKKSQEFDVVSDDQGYCSFRYCNSVENFFIIRKDDLKKAIKHNFIQRA